MHHFTPEDIGKTVKSLRETDTPMMTMEEESDGSSDSEIGLANVAFSFIHQDSMDLHRRKLHHRSGSSSSFSQIVPHYFVSWDSSASGSSFSHSADHVPSFFHLEESKPPPLFIGCTSWWEKHVGHVWVSIKTWCARILDRIQSHLIPQPQPKQQQQHAS